MPYEYKVMKGLFEQADASGPLTGKCLLRPVAEHFGFTDHSAKRWKKLSDRMKLLNSECRSDEQVMCLFVGRHGEGYHNVAIAKYGSEWNDHYGHLTHDAELTWGPDPLLTPLGERQATDNHKLWLDELDAGLPMPDVWYCSPMRRTATTLLLTFDSLRPTSRKPVFLENLREHNGVHTCDKRSPKSTLATEFPNFEFAEPFSEPDVLWKPDYRETEADLVCRLGRAMEEIIDREWGKSQYISITAHNGAIRAMTKVMGHPVVCVGTGGILPMIIKVKRYAKLEPNDCGIF